MQQCASLHHIEKESMFWFCRFTTHREDIHIWIGALHVELAGSRLQPYACLHALSQTVQLLAPAAVSVLPEWA